MQDIHSMMPSWMEWYTFYHDSLRDKFSAEKDRVITKEIYANQKP